MSLFEPSKFSPSPDPELICGICMNVLTDPVETLCRHVFCRECIKKALREKFKCPICRARCKYHQVKDVLPLLQNLINKLTMRCDYYDNGCSKLVIKEYYMEHVGSCQYVKVLCSNKDCGEQILKKDCEEHETKICLYRTRICEKGCGLPVTWASRESHNCMEALLLMVKELGEKTNVLEEKIGDLNSVITGLTNKLNYYEAKDGRIRDGNDSSIAYSDEDFHSRSGSHSPSSQKLKERNTELEEKAGDLNSIITGLTTKLDYYEAKDGRIRGGNDGSIADNDEDYHSHSGSHSPSWHSRESSINEFDDDLNISLSRSSSERSVSPAQMNGLYISRSPRASPRHSPSYSHGSPNPGPQSSTPRSVRNLSPIPEFHSVTSVLDNLGEDHSENITSGNVHSNTEEDNLDLPGYGQVIETESSSENHVENSEAVPTVSNNKHNMVALSQASSVPSISTGTPIISGLEGGTSDSVAKQESCTDCDNRTGSHKRMLGNEEQNENSSQSKKAKRGTVSSFFKPALKRDSDPPQAASGSSSIQSGNIQSTANAKKHPSGHKNTRSETNPSSQTTVSNTDLSQTGNAAADRTDPPNPGSPPASRGGPVTRRSARLCGKEVVVDESVIRNVQVPPSTAFWLSKNYEEESSDDESWSPSE